MFPRFWDIASFDASAIRRVLSHLRCAFAAIVTAVSVIPVASFANVFPVQGEIINPSRGRCGPSGSASFTVWIIELPVIFSTRLRSSSLSKKRVVVSYVLSLIIGRTSLPERTSSSSTETDFSKVQNEPQKAYPIIYSPFFVF